MKPSQKLRMLDTNVTTLLVVILLGLNEFLKQSMVLLAQFTTITVVGVDITLMALYGFLTTLAISYWLLTGEEKSIVSESELESESETNS